MKRLPKNHQLSENYQKSYFAKRVQTFIYCVQSCGGEKEIDGQMPQKEAI